jgi:hypothetical protein
MPLSAGNKKAAEQCVKKVSWPRRQAITRIMRCSRFLPWLQGFCNLAPASKPGLFCRDLLLFVFFLQDVTVFDVALRVFSQRCHAKQL